ncbi:MAG: DUF58 domain-containing protein [Micrococcales bacterium]|nr:DUF58 domain-containing protein [Micrococcales bacterium]
MSEPDESTRRRGDLPDDTGQSGAGMPPAQPAPDATSQRRQEKQDKQAARARKAAEKAAAKAAAKAERATAASRPAGAAGPGRPAKASSPRASSGTSARVSLPTMPTMPAGLQRTMATTRSGVQRRIEVAGERTRPAWEPLRRALGWISPVGWSVLLLGLVSWWAGQRFGWTEPLMIAAMCVVLFVVCVLLAVGRTNVTIDTFVDPLRVTAGEPATGKVVVTNHSRRGMLPLLVELPVGVSAARFTLPPLRAGSTHEEFFVVPTERRGVIPVGPATTVQGDPLGLARRTLEWTDTTELYVHPRTIPIESTGAGLLRDLEGDTTQDLSMSDLAFHALREYQPGDDRRYIHWRSSAKAGRLLVRQFLDTRRSHMTLIVDPTPEMYAAGEDMVETAIECGASLAVRSIRDDHDTTVICGRQSISRSSVPLTLDAFSRAEIGAVDIYDQAGTAAALSPDTSIVILVTGVHRPLIEAQRALDQFGPEVAKLLLVVDDAEQVGVRPAGGLTRMTVGELADLRRVVVGGVIA